MSNGLILLLSLKKSHFQQMPEKLVRQLPHNCNSQGSRRNCVYLYTRAASGKSTLSERQRSRIIPFFTAADCAYCFLNRIAFWRAAEADLFAGQPCQAVAK